MMQGFVFRRIDCLARVLILDQYSQRRTVEVLELPRSRRPEECGQASKAKAKCDGEEKGEAGHFVAPRKRNALATTISDEPDMANAATSGVT